MEELFSLPAVTPRSSCAPSFLLRGRSEPLQEEKSMSCRRIQNPSLCVLTPSHPHNPYKTPSDLYCTESAAQKVTPFVATVLPHPSGSSISLCADGFFINHRQANSLLSFFVGKLWHLCFPAWIFEWSSHCLVVASLEAV